ncbi:LexA family transcriptional regulator [Dehalococcoides mccartyi]|uniref:LexA family transcriptional regulator n=1 Tax=Dehalococcoides mccartyi TaxID=61435 RepID=UPI0003C86F71|nr:LexA family transcriptional regulator [Dehalococcoides mccartyi]AHB13566.1 transcriptional regulator [Dehalococcoides mccartyi GY50]
MMSIGEKIREFRKARGWTPEYLGTRSGLSGQYIRKLEKGERQSITLATANKLSNAFGIEPAKLISENEPVSPRQIEDILAEVQTVFKRLETVEICVHGCMPKRKTQRDLAYKSFLIPRSIVEDRKNIYALQVEDNHLEHFGIYQGEMVVIQAEHAIEDGNLYACQIDQGVYGYSLYSTEKGLRLSNGNGTSQHLPLTKIKVLGRILLSYKCKVF